MHVECPTASLGKLEMSLNVSSLSASVEPVFAVVMFTNLDLELRETTCRAVANVLQMNQPVFDFKEIYQLQSFRQFQTGQVGVSI